MTTSSSQAGARAHLQYFYPKRLLSALMHRATRIRLSAWKNWQIRWFIRRYGVNMDEALESEASAYPEFNTFFTRPLRSDARPQPSSQTAIASPADGVVLERGRIFERSMLQVKGLELDIHELLGNNAALTQTFVNGHFATVYLSPRDYHRVHMPVAGDLQMMGHIPGELFSVSLPVVYNLPRVFSRNERVVSVFETPVGPMALILVGAVFVGCIETVWAGQVKGSPHKAITWETYGSTERPLHFGRGQEMGRFNMGSTVIALFANGDINWTDASTPGSPVQVGTQLADWHA